MKKCYALTTLLFVSFLVGACQTAVTDPCDVLVEQTPSPETSSYIVANDRPFAVQVAQHRGRYQAYGCGSD